jgi:hypothetical protein
VAEKLPALRALPISLTPVSLPDIISTVPADTVALDIGNRSILPALL